jgi:hypothetical protein
MEIENLRAIYLPDMETVDGASTHKVIQSLEGLYWSPSTKGGKVHPFEVPFMYEDWMIMQSVLVSDSTDTEIFEMDIVEVEGEFQKYFIVIRVGYAFMLFDGHSGVLNDPQGAIWSKCKVRCPVWESSSIEDLGFAFHNHIQRFRKF